MLTPRMGLCSSFSVVFHIGHYSSYQSWWRGGGGGGNSQLFSFFQICVKASIVSVPGHRLLLLNLGIWRVL